MINGIITGAPIWVWPLLILLIIIGLRATKNRTVPIALVYALPLMGILSLNSISSMPHPSIAWGSFGAAYAVSCVLAYTLQAKWLVSKEARRVTLKGEWLTLLTMMTIFWMNFVGGIINAINPDLYTSAGFTATIAVIMGLASGSFLGRAWFIFRA